MESESYSVVNIKFGVLSLNEKIAECESRKRNVDKEVDRLLRQMNEVVKDLTPYFENEPLQSQEPSDVRRRRTFQRKLLTTSVVVTLSTVPVTIYVKYWDGPKKMLPWTIAVGLGSLACSCYLAKDVLCNFKEYNSRSLNEVPWAGLNLQRVQVPEVTVQPETPQKPLERSETNGRCEGKLYEDYPFFDVDGKIDLSLRRARSA